MKSLLVEDNPADARLIREMLREWPAGTFQLEQVARLDRALERLRQESFDVVLLDLGLSDSQGMETLVLAHKASDGVPIVVLTGLDDERFALEAMRAGAQDYLVKGRFDGQLLVRTIRYAVERKRIEEEVRRLNAGLERRVAERTAQLQAANDELLEEIAERSRVEEALRQTEAAAREVTHRLQAVMQAVPVGISFSDDTTCHRATGNPAVLAQLELEPQDNLSASAPNPAAPGRKIRYFRDGREISGAELPLQRAVTENRVIPPTEVEVVLPSGRRWFCEASGAPVRDAEGKVFAGLAVTIDLTARKLAEQALVRAEKLAAAGRMAAALAHEVNNPLAAITNCVYLALGDGSLDKTTRQYLRTAEQELIRVGQLTRQMLGFYRNRSAAEYISIGDMIDEVLHTYEHKLRNKNLLVTKEIAVQNGMTTVAGELRQVVSNIVANSIDALPDGGRLHIHTRYTCLDRGPQRRLMITVADNGAGISSELRERIFEPFFTTKQEFGTGLGLWVTRELLRKNRGSIRVRSRPGLGTVFTIFLPMPMAAAAAAH